MATRIEPVYVCGAHERARRFSGAGGPRDGGTHVDLVLGVAQRQVAQDRADVQVAEGDHVVDAVDARLVHRPDAGERDGQLRARPSARDAQRHPPKITTKTRTAQHPHMIATDA
jgi:hypothetical protein